MDLFTMAGIAQGLVVKRPDLAYIGIGQRAQSAGRIEGLVEQAIHLDRFVPFQWLQGNLFSLLDSIADVAVLVDEAVGGPGERVLQGIARMDR